MPSMVSIYSYAVMKSRKKIKKNAGRLNPHENIVNVAMRKQLEENPFNAFVDDFFSFHASYMQSERRVSRSAFQS